MRYPVSLIQADKDIALYIPDPTLLRSTYQTLLSSNPDTPFPFWAKIWASGYELAAFLLENPYLIRGKRVLEMGAGIGLPSFTIAQLVSEIIISDHDADAVELMENNIRYHKLPNAKALRFDWNDLPVNIKSDVLLLSDINYDTSQFNSLLALIRHFLEEKSVIILSTPQRINITPFAEALQGFITHSLLRVNTRDEQEVEIRILVLEQ